MKKYLALVLSACMLLAFTACARQPQPAISTDTQQIPNPWTDYASLDEAEAAAGFDLARRPAPKTSAATATPTPSRRS